MLNRLICFLTRRALALRYRVVVTGLREVRARGRRKILILPSHPALIDPVIVLAQLYPHFAPHTIADQDGGADAPAFRWLSRRFGVRIMPLVHKRGTEAKAAVAQVMQDSIAGLRAGENLLMYPAGHLLRSQREELGANSAVETFLREVPDLRVVLLRTRGLWGSSFSGARDGHDPDFGRQLAAGMRVVLKNLLFFTPRRTVTLDFFEPDDLPRTSERAVLNGYLEAFYNQEPLPQNTHVPYYFWEGNAPVVCPEPVRAARTAELAQVPAATRQIVLDHLRELSGRSPLQDGEKLGDDLGLDSLARAELLFWIGEEFGHPVDNVDALQTVGDVLLAATGEALAGGDAQLADVPAAWWAHRGNDRLAVAPGETVACVFLAQARRQPNRVVVADQISGVRTYRQLVTGIFALRDELRNLPGSQVGILLPGSVTATVVYLATLFAGKTPVLVNWTVGPRNILHSLDQVGVQRVVTSRVLISRLKTQGTDLSALDDRFVMLEDVAGRLGRVRKLRAWFSARVAVGNLERVAVSPTAAILFTSGSESLPKAVPLTHANVLTDLRDVLGVVRLDEQDRTLALLPPFHSFGLTGNLLLAVCGGMATVFHPNPTDGAMLARLVAAYRITLVLGTPTFLNGIVRAGTNEQLASLRLAVMGAEECPPRVYAALTQRCPRAVVLEGYGITECSPIVALNDDSDPRPHTVGRLIASLRSAIVSVETGKPLGPGQTGLLLVQGPTVFGGYLGEAPSPFVMHEGQTWYRTGDLVSADADGHLTFRGRLKRFVKIGGEMISLPAIESALAEAIPPAEDGPSLAVVATADERPELVLFTIQPLGREQANEHLKRAGLSALHNLRRVVQVQAIPTLGTGKVDYRALQAKLASDP